MRKKYILLIPVFIVILTLSFYTVLSQAESAEKMAGIFGQEEFPITVYLITDSGKSINNSLVNIDVKRSGRTVSSFSKYLAEGMPVNIQLSSGRWDIGVSADELSTRGKDYYGHAGIDVDGPGDITVHLLPAGTISGAVLDSLDNRVGSAELKIECSKEYGSEKPVKTDKFGTFEYDYAPVGECTVYAKYGGVIGSRSVMVEQGQVANAEIKLDKSIVSSQNNYLVYLGAAVITFISIIFIYLFKSRIKVQKEKKTVQKETLSQRAMDIIATLRQEEREVVECILNEGCSITQARVYHKTGIPKTSLSRYIQNLKAKGILATEEIGKMKKITLTEWFIGKK